MRTGLEAALALLLFVGMSLFGQAVGKDEVSVRSSAWAPTTVFRAGTGEVQVEVVVRPGN